ncbi:hypothetical protein RND81_06G216300 [Saponaria officinalis]|uniref:RWD domain-containing protein n=1 Tax=Saponaria officinalis TaxID=3572 RepID=A0AAW1KFE2_SAPOF
MGRKTPYHLNYVHRTQRLPVKIDWTLESFYDHPAVDSDDYDDDYVDDDEHSHGDGEHQETCAVSIVFKPSKAKNCRVVSKNRVEIPEFEVGGSSNGETEGGQMVEKESEVVTVEEDKDDEEEEVVVTVAEVGVCEEGGDEVLRRLQELENGFHELHLSQEQVNVDDQLQKDELLAMESIYGDNVYPLEKRQGLRSFQFHIDIDLCRDYAVSTKLKTATGNILKVDVSDEFSYTFNVQYLSPIVLTCLLPRSYPSHSPPLFTISVQWLHESKISKLCSLLDSLSNDKPGEEILHHWVEWLHSSTLHYLGFDEELVLSRCVPESSSDRRAISGMVSNDVDIPSLKSYNERRLHENFVDSFHECCICFGEYPGIDNSHFFVWP